MVVLYLNVILLLYIWSFISFVGCKGCQTSFRKRKVQAVNHLEQFRPPLESKQLQNLFLFIGLAENCIRQRR